MTADADPARPAAIATAVGAVLRELRTQRGMSRAELSARTGGAIAPSAIAGYESAYRALKLELLAILCEALEVRVHSVIASAERRANRRGRTAEVP